MLETAKGRSSQMQSYLERLSTALPEVISRKLREREWQPIDLAYHAGLSLNTVQKMLSGDRSNPTLETLARIAVALQERTGNLLDELEEAQQASAKRPVISPKSRLVKSQTRRFTGAQGRDEGQLSCPSTGASAPVPSPALGALLTRTPVASW